MSKNVLILSSSPRRHGNSDLLCDEFMKGAQSAGHYVEKVFLRDKDIRYCVGCGACSEKGLPCPQKDDMSIILDQMIHSDVIVMATPVYFYTMAAQMKTLIDRTCARYTQISNKEFYFIVTAADSNIDSLERTVEGFRGFLNCLPRAKEKGVIYGVGAWRVGEIAKTKSMKQAYVMGASI